MRSYVADRLEVVCRWRRYRETETEFMVVKPSSRRKLHLI